MKIPKIILCKEIPQWIISSNKAAFHPKSNTIYTTKLSFIPHETLHWLFCQLKWNKGHQIIDKKKNPLL